MGQGIEEILSRRYLQENETCEEQMYRRVARAMDDPDYEERFFKLMCDHKFMPNSPTLMNAGKPGGQLAACYVVGIKDEMNGIAWALWQQMAIHKSGGGTGFNFSPLRAKGSPVAGTKGLASGPVSFMRLFDTATEVVQQGGARRGANMGILDCDHPDILEFVRCKDDMKSFRNFNLSVRVTDAWMRNPDPVVWDAIITQAWKTGDPGLIFGDEIERKNPTPHHGKLEATNPCGESPLYPGEACNLGSMNLVAYCTKGGFNFDEFRKDIPIAVRFLDDVIDVSKYPMEHIDRAVKDLRKIGLGVMGYADMLYRERLRYGSPAALAQLRGILSCLKDEADKASLQLGEERGKYPYCFGDEPFRNATRTCIAPTGTISQICGCSSGIEPNWAIEYDRTALAGEDGGAVTVHWKNPYISNYDPNIHVVAHDVTWEEHVDTQRVAQLYIDLAVSKTVNLPADATRETVAAVYRKAWESKCKGITVYRDGCRSDQPLQTQSAPLAIPAPVVAKKRGICLSGQTLKLPTSLGSLYLTLNRDEEGRPMEVFATVGKSGRDTHADSEALGRLASLALRHGATPEELVRQLKGIGGGLPTWDDSGQSVLSIPDAVGRGIEALTGMTIPMESGDICPDCGSLMIREEGCLHCTCGYSRC